MSEVNELVAKVNFKFRGCGDFKRNVWASINVLVTQTIFRISGGLASRSRATQMRCSRQVKTLFQGLGFDRRWLNQFGGIFEAGEVG